MLPRVLGVGIAVVLLAGCRHAPPVALDRGSSSFAVVQPPPAPPSKVSFEPVESANKAQYRQERLLKPIALPVYPARALKAHAGRATVGVHVTVDVNGGVSVIQSSMLVFSMPGPFADDFRDAVEVALHQWKFDPARVQYMEAVTNEGFTYNRVARSENVETELDLSFTFTADGKVKM